MSIKYDTNLPTYSPESNIDYYQLARNFLQLQQSFKRNMKNIKNNKIFNGQFYRDFLLDIRHTCRFPCSSIINVINYFLIILLDNNIAS